MEIKLSDHFTYRKLLRFTLPSIITMIVMSIYSVVDGLFVSNLIGDAALSAVNIIFPSTMIVGALGFMLSIGGSAIVARTLGEGDPELANRYFSMIVYAVLILGTILSVGCAIFIEPIARLSGASDAAELTYNGNVAGGLFGTHLGNILTVQQNLSGIIGVDPVNGFQ